MPLPLPSMMRDLERTLVSRERIAERVGELGERIARDLETDLARNGLSAESGHVVLIPIMTGAIVFVADLIRRMPLKLSLEVVTVSSYPGQSTESRGARLRGDLPRNLAGKHVLVVDDILDSGQTLGVMKEVIVAQGPASLRICVLLRKPESRRVLHVEADYVGFDIPDEFVVGYGLDFDGYYRNHPEIATLRKPSA